MDKVDWALLISIGSLIAASGSAFYARRLALQDAKKMERKAPVISVNRCDPLVEYRSFTARPGGVSKQYPGHFSVSVSIRNREPDLGIKLISLDTKGRTRISDRKSLVDEKSRIRAMDEYLLDELPDSAFRSSIPLGYNLQSRGAPPHASGRAGDTTHITIYAKQEVKPADLVLRWEWLDGKRSNH